MSRRAFWSGLGAGTCVAISAASAGLALILFLVGRAVSPDKVGSGDNLNAVPFEIAGALLGGLLRLLALGCGIATVVFATLAGVAFWALRSDPMSGGSP